MGTGNITVERVNRVGFLLMGNAGPGKQFMGGARTKSKNKCTKIDHRKGGTS